MYLPISKIAVVLLLTGVGQSACTAPNRHPLRERAAERRDAPRVREKREAATFAGVQIERDVAYGSDPAQRLDVYWPEHGANAPVIFTVHRSLEAK